MDKTKPEINDASKVNFYKTSSDKDEYSVNDHKTDILKYKRENLFRVRVTTYIKGSVKNSFIDDCLRKRQLEVVVARNILDIHYCIIEKFPELKDMEFSAMKKYIIDKIKFE